MNRNAYAALPAPLSVTATGERRRGLPRRLLRAARLLPLLAGVALLLVWPLVMLVLGSFHSGTPFRPGTWSLDAWRSTLQAPGTLTAVSNSLRIAAISTLAATLLAAALAFLSERTDTPLRRWILPAMLMVFITPGVFYAIAFTLLANPYTGALNDLLRHAFGMQAPWLDAEGWGGIYTVLILKKTAVTYLFLRNAFRALDASHDEAAYISGAGPLRTFFGINLPGLAPALTSVALLGMIAGLQVFDPILVLGTSQRIVVISTLLMNLAGGVMGPAQYAQASVLSTAFVGLVALLYLAQHRTLGRRGFESLGGKGGGRRRPLRMRRAASVVGVLVLAYLLLACVLPLGALLLASLQPYPGVYHGLSLQRYVEVLNYPRVAQAIQATLVLGTLVGALVMTLAFAIAEVGRALGRGGWAALRFATLIPFAMPGMVAALAISWAWLVLPGFGWLYGSIWLVGLALVVVATPLATQIAFAATAQIAPSLTEAARISGAGQVRAFFGVTLVLAAPSFLAGWFMTAMMVAGNMEIPLLLKSPGVNTLAVISYNLQSGGDYGQAAALLILLMLATLLLWGLCAALRAGLPRLYQLRPCLHRHLARPRCAAGIARPGHVP
ncbi:MAG: ABC transporter permease subunit [Pseudoxanthomonas sp.]